MPTNLQTRSNRQGVRSRSGWTLVELMIAMATSILVVGAVLLTSIFLAKSFTILGNYHDLDKDSRRTLDVFGKDVRNMSNLVSCVSSEIQMYDIFGNYIDYKWDGSNFNRSLTSPGAASATVTVLLKNCDYLSVSNYQRNASANFTFVSASSTAKTKLIDVRWHCWRPVLGSHLTTESVQTAKIVVRNF